MEMGRLSVELGLSMRVRPVILREEGRVRVVRMRGISSDTRLAQSGCKRARR
jgi:hypothetical protein